MGTVDQILPVRDGKYRVYLSARDLASVQFTVSVPFLLSELNSLTWVLIHYRIFFSCTVRQELKNYLEIFQSMTLKSHLCHTLENVQVLEYTERTSYTLHNSGAPYGVSQITETVVITHGLFLKIRICHHPGGSWVVPLPGWECRGPRWGLARA